jgi:hypothetical protein
MTWRAGHMAGHMTWRAGHGITWRPTTTRSAAGTVQQEAGMWPDMLLVYCCCSCSCCCLSHPHAAWLPTGARWSSFSSPAALVAVLVTAAA